MGVELPDKDFVEGMAESVRKFKKKKERAERELDPVSVLNFKSTRYEEEVGGGGTNRLVLMSAGSPLLIWSF